MDSEEEGWTMKYSSNHCRSNAMQFAADQRGRHRGHLASLGSMQCLFLSPQTRVDLVVLELEVLVG